MARKESIGARISRAFRAAGIGAGAALCLLVGMAFLTVAGWIALVAAYGAAKAALIIGLAYTGFGLAGMGMASVIAKPPEHVPHDVERTRHSDIDFYVRLLDGFATGMQAGRKARRPH